MHHSSLCGNLCVSIDVADSEMDSCPLEPAFTICPLDLVRETSAVSGPVAENPGLLSEVTTELTDPKKPFTFIWLRVVSAASPTDYVAMIFWPFTARLVGKTCVSCLNSKLFVQRYLVNGWLLQNTAVTNTAINAATSSLDVCFYGEFVLAASGQNSPLENICVTARWKHKT